MSLLDTSSDELLMPQSLRPGDKIAIISPAGTARAGDVYKMCHALDIHGYKPCIMPHAMGRYGTFSGTIEDRCADFEEAWLSTDYKAIICTRGGYGAVQLLDRLDRLPLRSAPKWLVGFSDISAIHALLGKHRIASIHGPMAKYLGVNNGDNSDTINLLQIMSGGQVEYHIPSTPLNIPGTARGRLIGGNLSVISSLIGTKFDVFEPGAILFIEDIAEPIYKVQRTLYQLKLSGRLNQLSGLIVGAFTDYNPDANYRTMQQMIHEIVADCRIPTAFDFPSGHAGHSAPMVHGAEAKLTVDAKDIVIETGKV